LWAIELPRYKKGFLHAELQEKKRADGKKPSSLNLEASSAAQEHLQQSKSLKELQGAHAAGKNGRGCRTKSASGRLRRGECATLRLDEPKKALGENASPSTEKGKFPEVGKDPD